MIRHDMKLPHMRAIRIRRKKKWKFRHAMQKIGVNGWTIMKQVLIN